MPDPLLLPVTKDLYSSKDSSLAQMEQLLLAECDDMSLSSFLLAVLHIGLQYGESEFEPALSIVPGTLSAEFLISVFELCAQFSGLILKALSRCFLRLNVIEVLLEPLSKLFEVAEVRVALSVRIRLQLLVALDNVGVEASIFR